MKLSFLTAGSITAVLAILWSYLLLTLIAAGFRKKHFPKGSPNLAQSLVLGGKLLAGMILVAGIFSPVRDFLLVSPLPLANVITSGTFLSFLAICCCLVGVAFVFISFFEFLLSRQVFKGQAMIVELQENNLAIGVIRAILIVAIAFVLFSGLVLIMQAFIPVPAIPTIR